MSERQSINWVGQQRVDLPQMKMIDSSIIFDFQTLWTILQGTTPYIETGFVIATPWAAGNPASSLQVVVANSAVTIPTDPNGTYLLVPSGTPNEQLASSNTNVVGSFTPSSTNFVAVKFTRVADPATADLIALWDEDALSEFDQTVPLGLVLNYQFVVNTTGFGTNAPICQVQTDAFNNIVSITNSKQGLFRLGSGGITPDANHEWTYNHVPENPLTSTSSAVDPFALDGDWQIANLKNWMDAVMSAIKDIKGSAYWYVPGSSIVPSVNLSDLFFDAVGSVITSDGSWTHNISVAGQLSWNSDVFIRSIVGNLYYRIPSTSSPVTLANTQVAYISLIRDVLAQAGAQFTFTNSSSIVTCSVTITDALIAPGNWIKTIGGDQSEWVQIQSAAGSTIMLTAPYAGVSVIDKAVEAVKDYNVSVADPVDVPSSGDTYWISKRDDNAPAPSTISTIVRASNIVTVNTSAPHGLTIGDIVVISGVSDSSFDGTFEIISLPTMSSFTYDQTGANASSTGGLATQGAVLYMRTGGSLPQGVSEPIDSIDTTNIIQYIGSKGESDNSPTYSVATGTYSPNSIVSDGDNLTKAIKELDTAGGNAILDINQDRNLKLIDGGDWSLTPVTPSINVENLVNNTVSDQSALSTEWFGQGFTTTSAGFLSTAQVLLMNLSGGSLSGNLSCQVYSSSSGLPAALIGSGSSINTATLTSTPQPYTFTFTGVSLAASTQYFLVFNPSGVTYSGGNIWARAANTSPVGGFSVQSTNSGVSWFSDSPIDLYFIIETSAGSGYDIAWTSDAHIQIPGLADTSNTIPAGSVNLSGNDQVAYVEINRLTNTPTNLTVLTSDIAALTEDANTLIIARLLGSSGSLPSQTVDTGGDALNASSLQSWAQEFTLSGISSVTTVTIKLSRTGSPSGNFTCGIQADSGGNPSGTYLYQTSISVPTIVATPSETTVSIPVNATLSAGNYHIVITSDSTYKSSFSAFNSASIRVDQGSVTTPTVQSFDGTSWTTNSTDQFYFVVNGSVSGSLYSIIGTSSFRLILNESKEVDAGLSIQNRTLLGVSDEQQSSPGWNSLLGAPLRTIATDSQSVMPAVASIDTEIDKFFGQLRLKAANPTSTRVLVTNSDVSMLTGETRSQIISSLILQLSGAQIDFQTGTIYEADGVTALGINFSPVIPATSMFRWFSVAVVPSTANSNNTLSGQILVLPASADGSSPSTAPKAAFSSGEVINLGEVLCTSSNGTTITAIPQSSLVQLGIGSGSGGGGEDTSDWDYLDDLPYLVRTQDKFLAIPDANSTIDISTGKTNSNLYSVVNKYYRITYDASKTLTGSGTSMKVSAAPSYTVSVGDMLVFADQAMRITAIGTINSDGGATTPFTIEAAFLNPPSVAACCVSQAVYTKDLNNFTPVGGKPPSDAVSGDVDQIIAVYEDSSALNDTSESIGVTPNMAATASADGTTYSNLIVRTTNLTDIIDPVNLPTASTSLYLRFFSNATSGSGSANLLQYKVMYHVDNVSGTASSVSNQAYTLSNGAGAQINCTLSTVGGKTVVNLSFPYITGLNTSPTLLPQGQLRVFIDGQLVDRFINSTTTPYAWYTELSPTQIQLDSDYSIVSVSIEVMVPDTGYLDSSDNNASNVTQLQQNNASNMIYNPEGLLAQRIDPVGGTTLLNNTYGFDRWKMLDSADGTLVARVEDPAFGNLWSMKYQKATANGWFGFQQILEASESIPLRGVPVTFQAAFRTQSLQIPNVKIHILGWQGTPDTLSTTNIVSAWSSSPTFITNIVDYGSTTATVVNGYVNASVTATLGVACNNIIVFIHTLNSQSVGDNLWFTSASMVVGTAPMPYLRRKNADEIAMCQRYFEKNTSSLDLEPGSVDGSTLNFHNAVSNSGGVTGDVFETTKFQAPTATIYSPATGAAGNVRLISGSDQGGTPDAVTIKNIGFISTSTAASVYYYFTADADF